MKERVLEIARGAGRVVLEYYGEQLLSDIDYKADSSPLTQADRASHDFILGALLREFPGIPVISEESTDTYEGRQDWPIFWLVDPLDGTKEFIKRTGEFTINIALVEDRKPCLGVIHVPVGNISYSAASGLGAYRHNGNYAPEAITVRTAKPDEIAVVASRDHAGPRVAALLEKLPSASCLSMGSSLKFCLVAEGKADLYLRDVPTMEWDTAAAQCIVEESGGRVFDLNGSPLIYNKEVLRNPSIITVGDRNLKWRDFLG